MAGASASQYQAHEKDERWTAVDNYVFPHLHPESDLTRSLARALDNQHKSGLPDIAVSPLQGSFLAQQVRFLQAKHILEVGTLAGYSTIWLAGSRPDVKVTTVEYNPEHSRVAQENVSNAGLSNVEFIVSSGLQALEKLKSEVQAGQRPRYDFVFIDADKTNNLNYVNLALDMTSKGAAIIVDNVVRRGGTAIAELAKTDASIAGSRAVIEAAGKDPRLDATLIQTVGEKSYDGMLILRVI